MASVMSIWYDKEGDFLEITFKQAKGYLKEIAEDIYERVDAQGDLLGYSILNVSRHERNALSIPLQVERLAVADGN
ncbi:MAG: DUF2283 domain-containing protein [Chloroflexota bacterium]|nr:DUF2283 domain-containing protein [Chloroflexota bacterium]